MISAYTRYYGPVRYETTPNKAWKRVTIWGWFFAHTSFRNYDPPESKTGRRSIVIRHRGDNGMRLELFYGKYKERI